MVESRREAELVEGKHAARITENVNRQEEDQQEDQVSRSEVLLQGDEEDNDDEEEEEEEEDDMDDDDSGDIKTDCAEASDSILALGHRPEMRPSFGNIVVNSSSDVHFGNKTFYNGPVTIKQVVYSAKNGSVEVNQAESEFPEKESDTPKSEPSRVNRSLDPIWKPPDDSLGPQQTSPSLWQRMKKVTATRRFLFVIACTGALVILVTLVIVLLLVRQEDNITHTQMPGALPHLEEDNGVDFRFNVTDNIPSGKLRLIRRKEWLAQPPVHAADPLKHPVPYVVILHTATENCSTQAECVFFVRHTQTYHIESYGWWDIAYSFLVGGDGLAYEGRGWDGIGAFTYGYNNISIGIAFIGTFISDLPPPKQISAAKLLIAEGVKLGKISKDYKLFAHRQLSSTASPGEVFFEDIKTWDHWAEKPDFPIFQ